MLLFLLFFVVVVIVVVVCVVVVAVVVDDRFYIALFSALEQTHCVCVCVSNREMSLTMEAAVACMMCRTVV